MHFSLRASTGLRHRHLLAVPVAVLAMGLSVAGAVLERSDAQDAVVHGTAQVRPGFFVQERGDADWVVEDEQVRLRSGEVLVQADGLVDLIVAQAHVSVFNGAASVRLDDGVLSVAAVNASVLVQLDEHRALIAPGRQWSTVEPELSPITDWAGWLADRETLPVSVDHLRELRLAAASSPIDESDASDTSLTEERWLLSLVHPDHRDSAWLNALPSVSGEGTALAVLLAPLADLQAEPASDAIRRRVQVGLSELTAQQGPRFRLAYGPFLERAVQEMEDKGFTDRAQFYGDLLMDVQLDTASESSAASESASSQSSSCAAVDDAQAMQATVALLARLSAQRTTKTSITSLGTGQVRVEAMAFPGKTSDKLLSFTFDPGCSQILEISQGDQIMPNSLTLEQFEGWVGE